MTVQEAYNKALATGELPLSNFRQKLSHFGLVAFLLLPSVMLPFLHLVDYLQGNPSFFHEGELWLIFILLILSGLVFYMQRKRLEFKVIQTTLKKEQITIIIKQVAVELGWDGSFITSDIYRGKTNPGFFSGSWGEQITILLAKDRVLVNSICDPNKHASVVSMGRNRTNEETLAERINSEQQS